MKNIFLILLLISTFGFAQQPAFPTAFGGGAYASGGRGGDVYHVTKLTDDGSVGTFRWAIGQWEDNLPDPATIVFDVSGTIVLTNDTYIEGSNLTVIGQTAPEGGITITTLENVRFYMYSYEINHIWRYVRFRPANEYGVDILDFRIQPSASDMTRATNDGGEGGTVRDVIFDHCSFSYGGDEIIGFRSNNATQEITRVTFQRNFFAESKTGVLFASSDDSTVGSDGSFIYNAFFNISHRFPNINSNARYDVAYNLIHDWEDRLGQMYGDIQLNHINNHYSLGSRNGLTGFGGHDLNLNCVDERGDSPAIYSQGNYVDKGFLTDPLADNKIIWAQWKDPVTQVQQVNYASASSFVNNPYPMVGRVGPVYTGLRVRDSILADIGANKYLNSDGSFGTYQDVQDTFYQSVLSGGEGAHHDYSIAGNWPDPGSERTYWEEDPYLTYKANITTTPINTRPVGFYQSNPHIPEDYLTIREADIIAQGGNKNDPNLHNLVMPSGYTLLEEYSHGVDGDVQHSDIPVITLNGASTINLTVGDTYNELGATATDLTDGDISGSIAITGSVNKDVAGTYYRYYNVQDSESNAAPQQTRTVVYSEAGGGNPSPSGGNGGTIAKAKRKIIMN